MSAVVRITARGGGFLCRVEVDRASRVGDRVCENCARLMARIEAETRRCNESL